MFRKILRNLFYSKVFRRYFESMQPNTEIAQQRVLKNIRVKQYGKSHGVMKRITLEYAIKAMQKHTCAPSLKL